MIFLIKKLALWIIVGAFAVAGFGISQPPVNHAAIERVAEEIVAHSMNVQKEDLKAKENPDGKGIYIHTKKRDVRGIERKALWLVFENSVFPLNSTAKELSPQLKWPIELMPQDWQLTGLNLYSFHKSMQLIFG